MVQWLRLRLPVKGVWVQALVRELRFHMPRGQNKIKNQKKNSCCSAYSSLNSSHPTLTTNLFIVLPFQECHIVGIIQYVTFSDWLPSLNNKHLMFLHVLSCLNSSLLFRTE